MKELTGPPPPEPIKAVRADALQRADRAWTARVTGSTWREAAQLAGYSSPQHAMQAANRIYGELPRIDRDELRRLWRDRLEATWRQCCTDMADRVPGATTAAVRIVTAAAALDGLNEPTKVDVSADDFLGLFTRELNDAGF